MEEGRADKLSPRPQAQNPVQQAAFLIRVETKMTAIEKTDRDDDPIIEIDAPCAPRSFKFMERLKDSSPSR